MKIFFFSAFLLALTTTSQSYASDSIFNKISLGNFSLGVRESIRVNEPNSDQKSMVSPGIKSWNLNSEVHTFNVVSINGEEKVVDTVAITLPVGVKPSAEPLFSLLAGKISGDDIIYVYKANHKVYVAQASQKETGKISVDVRNVLSSDSFSIRSAEVIISNSEMEIHLINDQKHAKVFKKLKTGEFAPAEEQKLSSPH